MEQSKPQTSSSQECVLPQLHGLLVVDKPTGISSTSCLMQIKRFGQKKIGHAGTLDPLTTGVLLVLLGQATKLSSYLLREGGKIYAGTLQLGRTTDTWDSEGTVLSEKPWDTVAVDVIRRAIADWVRVKEQNVPPFSAAKKDGQPLYKLARKGTMVERTKMVSITKAEVCSIDLPFVHFRVHCSSGTYIRSLAHSLGMRLGCGAVLTQLTREFSYPFALADATPLAELVGDPAAIIRSLLPIRRALPDWPQLTVPDPWVDAVKTGQSIPVSCFMAGWTKGKDKKRPKHALLLHDDCELALATLQSDTVLEPQWRITRGLW